MRRQACLVAALSALCLHSVTAQVTDPQRYERIAGVTADGARQFFQRLRVAVGRDERATVCGLLAYPLAQTSGAIASAPECEARYDAIFTIDVRRAIGKQAVDELFVNERGVMIGTGEVWFAGRCSAPPCGPADLKVIAVNNTAGLVPPEGKVLLVCRVDAQLLHVTADGSGGARLSLWRSGRATDAPTLTIPTALDASVDGTCGAREWTFAGGGTRYTVSDLPCDAHLAPPPMGSVGRLIVTREGSDEARNWCDE